MSVARRRPIRRRVNHKPALWLSSCWREFLCRKTLVLRLFSRDPEHNFRNSPRLAFRDTHKGKSNSGNLVGKVGFPLCRFQLFAGCSLAENQGNRLPTASRAKPLREASAPTRRSSGVSGRHQAVATDGRAASASSPTNCQSSLHQGRVEAGLTLASDTRIRRCGKISG